MAVTGATVGAALADAGLAASDVDYMNAHATSTPGGDTSEAKAIDEVFGASRPHVSSTKSMTGHLLGAAGGVELAASVLAMQHGVVPPTINLDNPDPACDLDYVPNVARPAVIDAAMSNSFGFGGHNATLVIKKFVD